jgi:hypothetical protein
VSHFVGGANKIAKKAVFSFKLYFSEFLLLLYIFLSLEGLFLVCLNFGKNGGRVKEDKKINARKEV